MSRLRKDLGEKTCGVCGDLFSRRTREATDNYKCRRTCSPQCAAALTVATRTQQPAVVPTYRTTTSTFYRKTPNTPFRSLIRFQPGSPFQADVGWLIDFYTAHKKVPKCEQCAYQMQLDDQVMWVDQRLFCKNCGVNRPKKGAKPRPSDSFK